MAPSSHFSIALFSWVSGRWWSSIAFNSFLINGEKWLRPELSSPITTLICNLVKLCWMSLLYFAQYWVRTAITGLSKLTTTESCCYLQEQQGGQSGGHHGVPHQAIQSRLEPGENVYWYIILLFLKEKVLNQTSRQQTWGFISFNKVLKIQKWTLEIGVHEMTHYLLLTLFNMTSLSMLNKHAVHIFKKVK